MNNVVEMKDNSCVCTQPRKHILKFQIKAKDITTIFEKGGNEREGSSPYCGHVFEGKASPWQANLGVEIIVCAIYLITWP